VADALNSAKPNSGPTIGSIGRARSAFIHVSRRGARIRLGADVDDRQRPGRRLADELPRLAACSENCKRSDWASDTDLPQRALEQRQNNRPIDLDVFADVVRGAAGIELLSKPDAELRARQRERFAARRAPLSNSIAPESELRSDTD
jgi:hypothetical protein